jgi:hypothetical protein
MVRHMAHQTPCFVEMRAVEAGIEMWRQDVVYSG